MKHIIHKMYNPTNSNLGLLVLRLTLGSVFLVHGIQKLSNMEMTIGFFGTLGFSAFMTWVVALIEAVGGAAVIFGIGTKMWSSLFAIIMLVVITTVKNGKGFSAMELDIVLLGLALGVGLIGCGKWAVCHLGHKGTCSMSGDHCGCDCVKNDKK
ncbi:MAG TPA: DoxX family protein [Candidatus Paceibacterota bacterium]|nr:DoxX family protein [Candidatus Paceibacterota bacterium]